MWPHHRPSLSSLLCYVSTPSQPVLSPTELASAGEDPVATEPLQTSLSLTDPPVTTSRSQEGYGTASLLRGRLTSFQPTRPSSPYISLPSLRPGSHQATLQPLQPSPPPSPSLTPSARLAVVGAQVCWSLPLGNSLFSPFLTSPSLPLNTTLSQSPILLTCTLLLSIALQGPWEASSMSSTPCSAPSQRMV